MALEVLKKKIQILIKKKNGLRLTGQLKISCEKKKKKISCESEKASIVVFKEVLILCHHRGDSAENQVQDFITRLAELKEY